jgi:hypothetical protein
MMQTRDEQDSSYISIMNGLVRYEDNNMDFYSE